MNSANFKRHFPILVLVAVGLISLLLLSHKPEPSYRDRELSLWIEDLQSEKLQVVDRAFKAFGYLGEAAVPALIASLNKEDRFIHRWFSFIRSKSPGFIKPMIGKDIQREHIRAQAAAVLRQLGPVAAQAAPDLIHHLNDTSRPVANLSELALIQMGCAAVPELIIRLKSGSSLKPFVLLRILQTMGPDAVLASSTIHNFMMRSNDPDLALAAAEALLSVDGYDADMLKVAALNLESRRIQSRREAAEFLGRLGSDATSLLPQLERLLVGENPLVSLAAGESIHRIQPDHPGFSLAMARFLTFPDLNIRWKTAKALGRVSPEGSDALPALRHAMLNDGDKVVRIAAAESIGKYGKRALPMVSALEEAVWDEDDLVRSTANQSLAAIVQEEMFSSRPE